MKKKMSHPEIKKMKQGMSYSCKEKTIILNVFKYFCSEYPDKCVTELVRRTAKATGCSEKSVFQFRKEEASAEGFRQPSKTKIRKNININSRDIKYDDTVRSAIRNIIYDLRYKNIVPSLNTILKQIRENTLMPHFSLMTLRRLLFDMGFTYEKDGTKFILMEKEDKKKPQLNENTVRNNQNENEKRPVLQQYDPSINSVPIDNMKSLPHLPLQNSINVPVPQVNNTHIMEQPPPRLLPYHHEQPMMTQMHHPHPQNAPLMMNHHPAMPLQSKMEHFSIQPPPHHHRIPSGSLDMHMKHDMSPWIHHMAPQHIKPQ